MSDRIARALGAGFVGFLGGVAVAALALRPPAAPSVHSAAAPDRRAQPALDLAATRGAEPRELPARTPARGPEAAEEEPRSGRAPSSGEPAPQAAAITPSGATPEARRRRAAEVQAEALLALGRGEGQAALDALRVLAALGEEGDAAAIELARAVAADIRGGKKTGVTSYDLARTLQSDEVAPLLKRALLDPAADARFRANAVDNLGYSRNPDTLPFVLSLVEQERDPQVLDQMLGYLDEQSDPAVAATLARTLGGRASPEERVSVIQALGKLGGDDAVRALERAAADDPSADVRTAARVELIAQRPPVAGYLLSDVVASSQAARAGLRPGDVLLSYNGVAMTSDVSLGDERDKVPKGASVPVAVWRDGETIQITLQAGQIGVDGRPVTPR